MWNAEKSMSLSKLCTVVAGVALLAVLAGGPWLVDWALGRVAVNYPGADNKPLFLLTLYIGGALAALLLYRLYRLLHNLEAGQVFVPANEKNLRVISWLCFAGAAVGGVSGLYYIPWAVIGAAAAFMGLIVRVVKNVIAQAIVLKEENDFTI